MTYTGKDGGRKKQAVMLDLDLLCTHGNRRLLSDWKHVVMVVALQLLSCVWLQPHELSHARLPYPSPSPRVCSNSCPLSRWCHPIIPVTLVSSCPLSFPARGSFPMSRIRLPSLLHVPSIFEIRDHKWQLHFHVLLSNICAWCYMNANTRARGKF